MSKGVSVRGLVVRGGRAEWTNAAAGEIGAKRRAGRVRATEPMWSAPAATPAPPSRGDFSRTWIQGTGAK
jgi:hypothetical protein